MGLLFSKCFSNIANVFTSLLPQTNLSKHGCYIPDHPNNISEASMRRQITDRLFDKFHYFDLGLDLMDLPRARIWAANVAQFVPQNIELSLVQVINLICYTYDWPYAEVWKPDPAHPHFMYLQDYHVRHTSASEPSALNFERAMRNLGYSTREQRPRLLSWEIAGIVFTTRMSYWASLDLVKYSDPGRKTLISRTGFNSSFAVPVTRNCEITHVLVFYRRNERIRDEELLHLVQGMADEIGNGPNAIEGNMGTPNNMEIYAVGNIAGNAADNTGDNIVGNMEDNVSDMSEVSDNSD